MKNSFKLMNFVIYESYLFLQIFTISFYIYNIFWNMFWDQQMASVVWKSEETFWRGSDRIETADTMHNVIIPSGRVQNRQLGNQSLAAMSLLVQQERGKAYNAVSQLKNENSFGYPRTLGYVRLDFVQEILFPELNYDKYLASRLTTLFPLTSHAN